MAPSRELGARGPTALLRVAGPLAAGLVLAACSSGSHAASVTTEPVSGPAPSLVATTQYGGALIQWVASGKHLSGTYDGIQVQRSTTPVTTSETHCSVVGVANGEAMTVTLSSCTDSSFDGNYFGRVDGSSLSLDYPDANGAVSSVDFKPGRLAEYDAHVATLQLYVVQANGVSTYLADNAPAQAFFSPPTVSSLFTTPQGTDDVVIYQTNTAMDHAQALWNYFVLNWDSRAKTWLEVTSFPPSPGTLLPFPNGLTPIDLDGDAGVLSHLGAPGEELLQVLGDFGGHWQLVPFEAPNSDLGSLSPLYAFDPTLFGTSSAGGLQLVDAESGVVEKFSICGTSSCSTRSTRLL